MIAQPEWLTPTDAAKMLMISRETVYLWIREQLLPATDCGRGSRKPRYRIRRQDVVAAAERIGSGLPMGRA